MFLSDDVVLTIAKRLDRLLVRAIYTNENHEGVPEIIYDNVIFLKSEEFRNILDSAKDPKDFVLKLIFNANTNSIPNTHSTVNEFDKLYEFYKMRVNGYMEPEHPMINDPDYIYHCITIYTGKTNDPEEMLNSIRAIFGSWRLFD